MSNQRFEIRNLMQAGFLLHYNKKDKSKNKTIDIFIKVSFILFLNIVGFLNFKCTCVVLVYCKMSFN